jgi:hypothetical protein
VKGRVFLLILLFLAALVNSSFGQAEKGLRLIVLQKERPLIKLLIPGQPESERGIEIEFPEHITGMNEGTGEVEHLYMNTRANDPYGYSWQISPEEVSYYMRLPNEITMIATARLESDGLRMTYEFDNPSSITYNNLQAVTCVKLYSDFEDTRLERTYVHLGEGYELLALETPERLTLPIEQWLPCRYLVSYEWPVPPNRKERGADGILRYNKSRSTNRPFLVTLSKDRKWVAATYTKETGNLWTNPERTCQHADPGLELKTGSQGILELKAYVYKGNMEEMLFKIISEENK